MGANFVLLLIISTWLFTHESSNIEFITPPLKTVLYSRSIIIQLGGRMVAYISQALDNT